MNKGGEKPPPKPPFNPTMVRLLPGRPRERMGVRGAFNPTMVRLLLEVGQQDGQPVTATFNPTMVRLLPLTSGLR